MTKRKKGGQKETTGYRPFFLGGKKRGGEGHDHNWEGNFRGNEMGKEKTGEEGHVAKRFSPNVAGPTKKKKKKRKKS